jgi:xanthine dehydrogenase accessory factor
MTVCADTFEGTIGGGALEWEALAEARRRLASDRPHGTRVFPLGPALAQCCGGAATLAFERWDAARLEALAPKPGARLLARPLGGVVGGPDAPAAIRAARQAAEQGAPALAFAPGDPPWLAEPLADAHTPLWLWGAGHVGRAVDRVRGRAWESRR